jgi:polyisoprenoid-binding protein YceI
MKRMILFILMMAVLAPYQVMAETFHLDPSNTTIQFKVRNMGIMNVSGAFEKFQGTVDTDASDMMKSKVDVSVETGSINTGINMRDKHLRSADFFDAVKFPTMKFVGATIGKDGKGQLKLTGNLTIKGITKPIVLLVEAPTTDPGGIIREATATGTINRKDFGVSWGPVIGDEVHITISTKLNKQ